MKQKLIIGALIVVGLAAIAYAAFSQSLVINGTATTNAEWDVNISSITTKGVQGATVAAPPTHAATSATFAVNLDQPGGWAEFDVTIANQGTINAVLESITGVDVANTAAPLGVQYEVLNVNVNDVLNAGDTTVATVRVTWQDTATADINQTKVANITFNYVQDTL